MFYQLPLEQMVRHRGQASQLDFAWDAIALLEDADDARFHPSPRGLAVFAAHEDALARPLAVLRDRYGEEIEIPPPRVRCLSGSPVREPVMALRVAARREHSPAVLAELRRRNARIVEECRRGPTDVIRAEAPLRDLLGFGPWLERLAGADAQHVMCLSRYEP